mmetsp:Transcript_108892/g.306880  ORF Transcript_108892/g.306880 Transcript_108892/m.306880 type:complete len:114 (+) Transcript_108892:363-704(+)
MAGRCAIRACKQIVTATGPSDHSDGAKEASLVIEGMLSPSTLVFQPIFQRQRFRFSSADCRSDESIGSAMHRCAFRFKFGLSPSFSKSCRLRSEIFWCGFGNCRIGHGDVRFF